MNKFGNAQKGTVIALAVIALFAGCDKRDDTPASGSRDSSSTTTTPSYQSPPPTTGGTSGSSGSPTTTTTPGTMPDSGSSSPGSTTGSAGGTSPGDTSTGTGTGSSGTGGTSGTGTGGTGTGTGTGGTGTGTGTGGQSSLDDPSGNKLATAAELRSRYGVEVIRVASTTDSSTTGKLSNADKGFIKDAAVDGLYEVEIGKIASQRAADPAVKSFAQMLVNHHSAANDELKQLASSRNVEIATELPMMKRRSVERLSKMSGSEFDREFVNKVAIKEHEKDIKRFEEASREAKDPEVRAWAEKTLPTLRQHLADAQKLPPAASASTGRSSDTTSSTGPSSSGMDSSSSTPRSGMDRPDSSSGSGGGR